MAAELLAVATAAAGPAEAGRAMEAPREVEKEAVEWEAAARAEADWVGARGVGLGLARVAADLVSEVAAWEAAARVRAAAAQEAAAKGAEEAMVEWMGVGAVAQEG